MPRKTKRRKNAVRRDATDAYFTPEWQEKEAEVDASFARGEHIGPFDIADEAIAALHRAAGKPTKTAGRRAR